MTPRFAPIHLAYFSRFAHSPQNSQVQENAHTQSSFPKLSQVKRVGNRSEKTNNLIIPGRLKL